MTRASVEQAALRCAMLASEARILALVADRGRPTDPDREASEFGRQAGRVLREAHWLADEGASPLDLRLIMTAAGLSVVRAQGAPMNPLAWLFARLVGAALRAA